MGKTTIYLSFLLKNIPSSILEDEDKRRVVYLYLAMVWGSMIPGALFGIHYYNLGFYIPSAGCYIAAVSCFISLVLFLSNKISINTASTLYLCGWYISFAIFYFDAGESVMHLGWFIFISLGGYLLSNPKLSVFLTSLSFCIFLLSYIITHIMEISLVDVRYTKDELSEIDHYHFFALSVFSIFAFFYYNFTRTKLNSYLVNAEQIVLSQETLLNKTQLELDNAIEYAEVIQNSILASPEEILKSFSNTFIFSKPRDVVSGDFYWCNETENHKVILVADCTGHGIPGAFMSLIGTALLNEISTNETINSPATLLTLLNEKTNNILQQNESHNLNNDGMDVSMLFFDKKSNKLLYSSAGRPLYYVRDKKLLKINQRSHGIGLSKKYNAREYFDTEIDIATNDMFYLFSDGFADQFGEATKKKFKLKRLRELFINIAELDTSNQLEVAEKTFFDWKGTERQVDDVTIIGIKG